VALRQGDIEEHETTMEQMRVVEATGAREHELKAMFAMNKEIIFNNEANLWNADSERDALIGNFNKAHHKFSETEAVFQTACDDYDHIISVFELGDTQAQGRADAGELERSAQQLVVAGTAKRLAEDALRGADQRMDWLEYDAGRYKAGAYTRPLFSSP
jgi:hypothetical protein